MSLQFKATVTGITAFCFVIGSLYFAFQCWEGKSPLASAYYAVVTIAVCCGGIACGRLYEAVRNTQISILSTGTDRIVLDEIEAKIGKVSQVDYKLFFGVAVERPGAFREVIAHLRGDAGSINVLQEYLPVDLIESLAVKKGSEDSRVKSDS